MRQFLRTRLAARCFIPVPIAGCRSVVGPVLALAVMLAGGPVRAADDNPAAPPAAGFPVGVGGVFRDCADCPEMVVVPAGAFVMGSTEEEAEREGVPPAFAARERPAHRVVVDAPFAVGRFHVTRGDFAAFERMTGYGTRGGCWIGTGTDFVFDHRRSWTRPGYAQTDRDPVVCVSWQDAVAYAAWVSTRAGHTYRLLTEAEWEYAARGGTAGARWWGSEPGRHCGHANAADASLRRQAPQFSSADCDDGFPRTSPVDAFPANPFGLFDVLGNAGQWVQDCWLDNYVGAPDRADRMRTEASCVARTARGGAWSSVPWRLRAAVRLRNSADIRFDNLGFRLARSPATVTAALPPPLAP